MFTVCVAAVALCLLGAGTVRAQDEPPDTVPELDLSLYLGRWYQMFTSLIANQTFQNNSYCVTATYRPYMESDVSVYNSGNLGSPVGPIDSIFGFAYVINETEPGKLCVNLRQGRPECGDYWVIKLGNATFREDGLYQYSIVTTPDRLQLFVLARDVDTFRAEYQEEVLAFLADNGFDDELREPLETYQGPDCAYAPLPPPPNPPPQTVTELDVNLYLGRWYQMYCSFIANVTVQANAYCATADYGAVNATVLSVYNAYRAGGPTGEVNDISGFATFADASDPGKLCVEIGVRKVDCDPNYWIIALGPETFGDDGLYAYAVVTNGNRSQLFVLARDPDEFRADYEDEVLQFVADSGFTTLLNEPRETYQAADCDYAPLPAV